MIRAADPLAAPVRAADDAHADSLATGDARTILVAWLAALRATRALAVDSGEDPTETDSEIRDAQRDLARL